MVKLLLVGFPPILLAAALSPWLFPLAFGSQWERAGFIVTWIAPLMLAQIVVSPVSMALHTTDNQAAALLLQVLGAVLRIGAVFLPPLSKGVGATEWYALSGLAFYLAYALVVLRCVSGKTSRARARVDTRYLRSG